MPLDRINASWITRLSSVEFSGLAGLVNLTGSDYETIRQEFFAAAGGDVTRLIWKTGLFPAAALVGMSRAALMAYGENFWENFGTEIGIIIPVNRRAELTDAFCRAAARSIPGYQRANWEAWKYAGEFLAQAGLPLHHCSTFARVLRLAVDDTGLPEVGDTEGFLETIERMLSRSELNGQIVIQKALRGPAGPLLVEAVVSAISAGDFDRFNSELAKALHESFDSHPRQAAGQTLRRPFLQLDRDRSGLELHCPYPPAALCNGQGIVWSINGERHRVPHGQPFVVPVTKPTLYSAEIHGLNGGRPVKWTIDARPASWPRGFSAFNAETGRNVRMETATDGLLLAPGDYYLLHESRWNCDDATDQAEWSEGGLTLTRISIKPGSTFVFYDDDAEVRLASAKAIWLDASGLSFASSTEEKKVHYGWDCWPRLWIDAEANAADWSVEIGGGALRSQSTVTPLDGKAGGLRVCELSATDFLKSLPPGLHRIVMTVRHRDRIRHRQEWLIWVGLVAGNGSEFAWSARPVNLLEASTRGFTETSGTLTAGTTQEQARQIVFQMGPETLALKWLREGMTLESCEVTAGGKRSFISHKLGEAFAADEYSKTHLRISLSPAGRAIILVNGTPFQKAVSAKGFIQFDISLASVSALHKDGGKIEVTSDDAPAVVLARFARPMIARRATLQGQPRSQTAGEMKQLLLLITGKPLSIRLKIKDLLSRKEFAVEGLESSCSRRGPAADSNPFSNLNSEKLSPSPEMGVKRNLWFNISGIPAIKCTLGGEKTIGSDKGWTLSLSIPMDRWPSGAWVIEMEGKRESSSLWETIRDRKGGRLPILIPQNADSTPSDYRSHALWYGLASRKQQGFRPSKLWPAESNELSLMETYREVSEFFRQRISSEVLTEFENFLLLRNVLASQLGHFLDSGNIEAAEMCVTAVNQEESTSDPRNTMCHSLGILALKPDRLLTMEEGDILRTSLLWCGRLAESETIAGGFHRIELDPTPALGSPCPCHAPVLKFFGNGNRLRSNGTLPSGEEFTRFDYRRFFESLDRASLNPDTVPASVAPLSPEHFGFAIQQFRNRRATAESCSSLSNVNTIFSKSNLIAKELVSRVPKFRPLMPESIWMRPWPEISVEDDNLAEMAVRFASIYALTARLAGENRLSFREFSNWLRHEPWLGQDQPQAVNQATTTLICQAPELFGFFLMFWQLMIQTYPHD